MKKLAIIARDIRKKIIGMHARSGASHIGSALSVVDILTVLYFRILKLRPESKRDHFILSKGHAGSALYAVLAKKKIIPERHLATYCRDGGRLCGHSDNNRLDGIEASTGSLGHGLSIACGMAIAARHDKKKSRIFVLMGDGECNEGSVWEAAMFAAHHRLDNIVVIIDRNHLQGMGRTEEVMGLEPLLGKWTSFGWKGRRIDGHNLKEIEKACLRGPFSRGKPSVIIAETSKGKGVSFMEDQLEWHYKSPNRQQSKQAISELDGAL